MFPTDPDSFGSSAIGLLNEPQREASRNDNGTILMIAPSEQSTSKAIDIALFGGAFDPITLGHMAVMMGVYAQTGYPVWVMPCYQHMFGKEMAPPTQRLLMCEHICDALGPDFRAFPYEIEKQHNGSTYELLKMLKEKYPQFLFHIVVGSDNIPEILNWDQGRQLVKEHPLIIVDRPGYEINSLIGAHPQSRHITVGFPSASSDVRTAIEVGNYETAKRQLYWKVWREIAVKRLYGHKGTFGE